MSEHYRNMLSFGVLLLIIVVVILLTAFQVIGVGLIVPVFLVLTGCWTLAVAFMRSSRSTSSAYSFGTLGLGIVLIALGVAWYIFSINWLYSLALILFVLGAIAVASALRRK